jgi:hypothetical protein
MPNHAFFRVIVGDVAERNHVGIYTPQPGNDT